MKSVRLFVFLALASASASAAELLWQNFDTSPTGSVAALSGWSRAAWLGGITGRVDDINYSWSDPNILELPWNGTASSAVFTNFSSTYTTNEHPVIRCSAKLLTANTNAFFQLGLRNSSATNFLSFQSTNGYGAFGFLFHDPVFFPLVRDRFVDVTFFYNRSNNSYRLDYDYTNRLAWATNGESGLRVTNFNQFVVTRPAGTASTTGSFLVDDASVETFPPHVWAWWRCAPDSGRHVVEQLGSFKPANNTGSSDFARAGSSDPIWDGTADFHNTGATRQLIADPADAALPLPATTNWSLECAVRMAPATGNTCFFDWSTNYGFSSTSAWIQIGYSTNGYIYANLRDSQQGSDTSTSLGLRDFTPNGRWQHLAIVKSNASLSLYVDYQRVTNQALDSVCDGSYAFSAQSHASIGIALNNGNANDPDTLFDEVRFSGKALVPAEFLQPGQPLVVDIDNSPTNAIWELTAKCILGQIYRLETSPSAAPAAIWQPVPGTTFTSAYTFTFVDVSNTVPQSNVVRLVRQR